MSFAEKINAPYLLLNLHDTGEIVVQDGDATKELEINLVKGSGKIEFTGRALKCVAYNNSDAGKIFVRGEIGSYTKQGGRKDQIYCNEELSQPNIRVNVVGTTAFVSPSSQ